MSPAPAHRLGVPMDPELMQEMTEFDYQSPTQPSRRSMMSPLGVSQMMYAPDVQSASSCELLIVSGSVLYFAVCCPLFSCYV